MLRERNTFVLKARSGSDERQHALTLHVNVREEDLAHFNGKNGTGGATAVQLLDDDETFQALVREIDDLRQLDQLVKTKAKEGTHTLQVPDVTVQWQVSEEPGLPSVLHRVQNDDVDAQSTADSMAETSGTYRPVPMRKLVVAVWMYPPHVEIPPTGDRMPVSDTTKQDFFVGADDNESVKESEE
ncbi:Hypothetical protein PHPALM_1190 [Phytophthora palmivora]|uniref:Uncharacterized protein n=1 Tax=Phytophthora palmivora TaxID=4796 RepID=A0A2P4YSY2_9STRA|nr:Hypothetical protein PHPALM_1190 [Phytophthora palmivora]